MLSELRAWVKQSVKSALGATDDEADAIAAAAFGRLSEHAPQDESLALRAGEIVGLCRVTEALPWVRDWWRTDQGMRARAELGECPDLAWIALNEALNAPSPGHLDGNWPAEKVFRVVSLPAGSGPGDEFVLGDGEGNRYVMEVVEQAGVLGAQVRRFLGAPLDSYWWQALTDAQRIIGRDEAHADER